MIVGIGMGACLLAGCSQDSASSGNAAPGVTPPAHPVAVASPTTAPGHVSGAMKARQEMDAMKNNK
jgi:hypothetical protein